MLKRRLFIRLGSLGDVILSSGSLEASSSKSFSNDWLTSKEYAEIFQNHPKISRLLTFTKRSGLMSWIRLCQEISSCSYDEIVDLHVSLRTRILRFVIFLGRFSGVRQSPRWTAVSKEKFSLMGYLLFKRFWPRSLRPSPWVRRYARISGGGGMERPNLSHLIPASFPLPEDSFFRNIGELIQAKRAFFCVMPASRWPQKTWPLEKYVELLERSNHLPIILGTANDVGSVGLVERLVKKKIPHLSGVGKLNLKQTAWLLSQSRMIVSGDTGLVHLAESVGTRAFVLFGPTAPDMGFRPWKTESRTFGTSLWCRPCSKLGNRCYRPIRKKLCLTSLPVNEVLSWINLP